MKYNISMTRARKLLLLGVWIAVLPYLGFPSTWKNIIFSICGIGLMYFSYILYIEHKKLEDSAKVFDNFSENNNFTEKELL